MLKQSRVLDDCDVELASLVYYEPRFRSWNLEFVAIQRLVNEL